MFSSLSRSSSPTACMLSESWSMIQHLNNRGCVLLMNGNYIEANRIFEFAITKHKHTVLQVSQAQASQAQQNSNSNGNGNGNNSDSNDENLSSSNCTIVDPATATISAAIEATLLSSRTTTTTITTSSSVAITAPVEEARYNDDDDSFNQEDEDEYCRDDEDEKDEDEMMFIDNNSRERLLSSSTSSIGRSGLLRRMTTNSRLMTLSYAGQQDLQAQAQQDQNQQGKFQQVYSLPIVMNEEEWELSSIEDKSFVLIYNTALCSHLYGMSLFVTIRSSYNQDEEDQEDQEASTSVDKQHSKSIPYYNSRNNSIRLDTNKNNKTNKRKYKNNRTNINTLSDKCERAFHVAKNLYRLALENVISFVNGVDQLCYVAMFNNMSHVYKTLHGYNSQEANRFDLLLLKAIYWWKDTNSFKLLSSQSQQQSQQQSVQQSSNNNASSPPPLSYQQDQDDTMPTATASNHNNASSSSSCYDDNDLEIIDSFLENVFYLVGVPNTIVPAPAA